MPNHQNTLIVRDLGLQEYQPIWQAMKKFTAERNDSTADELWCLQHPPVFTMGLNGKEKHLLNIDNIPIINIDRGGQVTYHAPGQLIIYTLIDLARLNIGVKDLVNIIEQSIIQLLARYKIIAKGKENAPGVYVEKEKIAALGLRIKRNKSYHGLSLNIDMDLSPFKLINPCGYEGLQVTQIKNITPEFSFNQIQQELVSIISQNFYYKNTSHSTKDYNS